MISILNRDNFRLAYRSIKASKARSYLTMFGVVVGVMAVTLVISIGQGLKEQIADQLGNFGKNVLTVTPGNTPAGLSVLTGLSSASSSLLTTGDLHTVERASGVAEAVPIATASGTVTGDHTIKSPYIVATNSNFPDIIHEGFSSGSFFGANDQGSVVLGTNIAQKLFNDDNPLGQGLIWRGQRFIVTGIYDYFNAPPFSIEANFDNAIFMSYDAAQQASGGSLGIYRILARSNTADASHAISSVRSALISAHGGADDITVTGAASSVGMSNQTLHLLALLVGGAATIALIVSGVGIMDVMLVSVTERMHEIGLRKAIGATNRQILRQFIAEAFVLSALGAIVGIALSAAGVGLLRAYTSIQAVIVWQAMVVAPVVAIIVGVFFGAMPALKAARKDPIEALRHE